MDPRRQHGADTWEPGAFGTRSRTQPIWSVFMPADGNRAANMGTGDFGTSPIFVQLSDKPLLASVCLLGVSERKAQWQIEKLRVEWINEDLHRPHERDQWVSPHVACFDIVLDFGRKGAHARISLIRLSERSALTTKLIGTLPASPILAPLVSRFRSSQALAAPLMRTSGIKGTLATL